MKRAITARSLAVDVPRWAVVLAAVFMCFGWAGSVGAWWAFILAGVVGGLLVPMTRGASSEHMELRR